MKYLIKTLFFISFIIFTSCDKYAEKYNYNYERIEIDNFYKKDSLFESFITPFRENIEKDLYTPYAYSVKNYNKKDGELNTAIGNMMADAVYKLSNPIFKSLTGENIDMVLLNYGGIRSSISIGNINKKTAYNIMPFENDVVVTKLSGEDIFLMIEYLIITKQAHPISNAQIILNNNYELISAKVNNKLIRNTEYYNVATSNFLLNGGDKMDFFSNSIKNTKLNYKIRDLLIDYFISIDTLNLTNDKRFYIKR